MIWQRALGFENTVDEGVETARKFSRKDPHKDLGPSLPDFLGGESQVLLKGPGNKGQDEKANGGVFW